MVGSGVFLLCDRMVPCAFPFLVNGGVRDDAHLGQRFVLERAGVRN